MYPQARECTSIKLEISYSNRVSSLILYAKCRDHHRDKKPALPYLKKTFFDEALSVGELHDISYSGGFVDIELWKIMINTHIFILSRILLPKKKSLFVSERFLHSMSWLRVLGTLYQYFKEREQNLCTEACLNIKSQASVADASKAKAYCRFLSINGSLSRFQHKSLFRKLLTFSHLWRPKILSV